jgi:hypothetical protein
MSKRSYLINPAGGWRAGKTEHVDEQQKFENYVESSSHNVSKLVTGLAESIFPSLRSHGASIDEELEALLVKEARLRWLVRVARYSEGVNRKVLWLEADKLLVELEKTADAMLYAKCA